MTDSFLHQIIHEQQSTSLTSRLARPPYRAYVKHEVIPSTD